MFAAGGFPMAGRNASQQQGFCFSVHLMPKEICRKDSISHALAIIHQKYLAFEHVQDLRIHKLMNFTIHN